MGKPTCLNVVFESQQAVGGRPPAALAVAQLQAASLIQYPADGTACVGWGYPVKAELV